MENISQGTAKQQKIIILQVISLSASYIAQLISCTEIATTCRHPKKLLLENVT